MSGKNHSEVFDFVVANGRACQLAQTFSFHVPEHSDLAEKIKAWAWTVGDIRQHGGLAQVSLNRKVEVPREVDIGVVYVPPPEGWSHAVLTEALSAFEAVHATAVPLDRAQEVGQKATAVFQATPA